MHPSPSFELPTSDGACGGAFNASASRPRPPPVIVILRSTATANVSRPRSFYQRTRGCELQVVVTKMNDQAMSLSRRKDHSEEKVNENLENDSEPLDPTEDRAYPFAVVLRLRVLQIVCGIAALVMGTVAIIEEKGRLNLGLGIPAGGATIIAAAASIHTSRGFEGYRPSTCMPGSPFRFLGPSVRIALPLTILWGIACSFQVALIIAVTLTLAKPQQTIDPDFQENEVLALKSDMFVLAGIELGLAALTILAVGLVLRIDCKYDPD